MCYHGAEWQESSLGMLMDWMIMRHLAHDFPAVPSYTTTD